MKSNISWLSGLKKYFGKEARQAHIKDHTSEVSDIWCRTAKKKIKRYENQVQMDTSKDRTGLCTVKDVVAYMIMCEHSKVEMCLDTTAGKTNVEVRLTVFTPYNIVPIHRDQEHEKVGFWKRLWLKVTRRTPDIIYPPIPIHTGNVITFRRPSHFAKEVEMYSRDYTDFAHMPIITFKGE